MGGNAMVFVARSAVLLALFGGPAFSGSWPGSLVDAKCYAALERNVNPNDTLSAVDRDRVREIRYCSPKVKTKTFAFVDHDGLFFQLDSAGNAKASEFVRNAGRHPFFPVVINGEKSKDIITVDAISAAAK